LFGSQYNRGCRARELRGEQFLGHSGPPNVAGALSHIRKAHKMDITRIRAFFLRPAVLGSIGFLGVG